MKKQLIILGQSHDLENSNGVSPLDGNSVQENFTVSYTSPDTLRGYHPHKDRNLYWSNEDNAGKDLYSNATCFYSAQKEQVFMLKDQKANFVIIAQEFWDGKDNTIEQDHLLNLIKDDDRCGFNHGTSYSLYKIFVPQAELKNLVGAIQPIITSPDSIQDIGDALLKDKAGIGEFKLNFIQ